MTSNKPFNYHVNTRNASFLQTYKELADRGINNNKFFLKLYDPVLENVDPFDPQLTTDLRIRVVNEVINNPWYFLRECVRLPVMGRSEGTFFYLHRGNLAAIFSILNGIDHYLILPRQMYMTASYCAILNWLLHFGAVNTGMDFFNKTLDDNHLNLRRMEEQMELLPTYLQLPVKTEKTGEGYVSQSLITRNRIFAHPSACSVEQAEKIARTAMSPIQFFDHIEYTKFAKTFLDASAPLYAKAKLKAEQDGVHSCRIITSPMGDPETNTTAADMVEFIGRTARWDESFYDRHKLDIADHIQKQSSNGVVYIEYEYHELRKDQEWVDQMSRILNGNQKVINREVLLKR